MLRFSRKGGARVAFLLLTSWLCGLPAASRLHAQDRAAVRVIDAHTGEPLAAVRVRAAGWIRFTGGDGRIDLPALADTVTVEFRRPGYAPLELAAGAVSDVVGLDPAPVLLDAVVVEAPRSNTLAAGTMLTVGGVDEHALHAGGHTAVAEALEGAEAVSVARMGAWGSRPFLRGLGGERLAILIDGNRVNRACAFGMDQGLSTIDPQSVERVEVLTGPGSALYGSGNIGGVINVVTRRRGDGPLSGEVRAGASSGVPGGTLGASIAVERGPFELDLSLDGSRYGDYRAPGGAVDGSGYRHATGDLQAVWTPDPVQRLTFRAQAYEGRDIGWPAMGGMGSATIPVQSRRSFSLDYGAQLSRGVVDGFAARAYVQRLDHDMDVTMSMTGAGGMTMTSTTGQRSHSTTYGGRMQLRLLPTPASRLDVGVETTGWDAENTRWTESGGMGGTTRLEFRTWPGVRIQDLGVFGQGEVPVGDAVSVSLGARVDRILRSADDRSATDEWVGSGNAGIHWRLPLGFAARASIGYGYRIPDPTELYGLALRPDGFIYQGNPELETETNRNIEASLTWDRPGVSASLTAFRNDLSGLISPVAVAGDSVAGRPVRSWGNLDEARLSGASGSLQWEPRPALRLSGTVAYTRGEDRATGDVLPAIPPLEGSLAVQYSAGEHTWLEVEGLAAARQSRNAAAAGEPETPGYGVVNARVGFRLAGVATVVGADNVLDHAYRAHLDPVSLLRPGRNLYVKVSRRFPLSDGGRASGDR